MTDRQRPERPGPDATADEIAAWMDADFGWTLATALEDDE